MNRKMLKSKIHRATVFVDENNQMLPTRREEAGQAKLKKVVW